MLHQMIEDMEQEWYHEWDWYMDKLPELKDVKAKYKSDGYVLDWFTAQEQEDGITDIEQSALFKEFMEKAKQGLSRVLENSDVKYVNSEESWNVWCASNEDFLSEWFGDEWCYKIEMHKDIDVCCALHLAGLKRAMCLLEKTGAAIH